jgi:hypothetical protein
MSTKLKKLFLIIILPLIVLSCNKNPDSFHYENQKKSYSNRYNKIYRFLV